MFCQGENFSSIQFLYRYGESLSASGGEPLLTDLPRTKILYRHGESNPG